MKNVKVSVEYANKNRFKGQIHSIVSLGRRNFYAMTPLIGGTFSTFDQVDEFMKKVGYYKSGRVVNV